MKQFEEVRTWYAQPLGMWAIHPILDGSIYYDVPNNKWKIFKGVDLNETIRSYYEN